MCLAINKFIIMIIGFGFFGFTSCRSASDKHDATGIFESNEIIISAEASGKIIDFTLNEGDIVDAGQVVVSIDSIGLFLQKEQAQASVNALFMKQSSALPQILVFEKQLKVARSQVEVQIEQLKILKKEQKRILDLYEGQGATAQQLDDINGRADVLKKQIEISEHQQSVIQAQIISIKDQISIQNRGISSDKLPLEKRIEMLDDQIDKTYVRAPKFGTILTKYADSGEFIGIGKPLFKLADLSVMTLKAYITGNQLPTVKIGDDVSVFIDNSDTGYFSYTGKILSIAEKAEFTPKTIQTKEERANLVYAVKVSVKNDGKIKIGMYGEVSFKPNESSK